MTRKSRQFFGPAQRWRTARCGSRAALHAVLRRPAVRALAALVMLALLTRGVGGCLVTENKDIQASTSVPVPVAISPALSTRVQFVADPGCDDQASGTKAMQFEVAILDKDTTANLYTRLYINGVAQGPGPIEVFPTGAVERSPANPLCVRQSDLGSACNLVQFFVSSNYQKVLFPVGPRDPDFGMVQWLVLGPSGEQPDADDGDCAARFGDGGV